MPNSHSAKRVLLDTNIYATIIERTDVKTIEMLNEDKKTMLSANALKAYEIVNKIRNLKMPNFVGYNNFRRLFSV